MNRRTRIIQRAAELIELDSAGKVTNLAAVCEAIEREFNTTTYSAYRYVTVEAATLARRKKKGTRDG